MRTIERAVSEVQNAIEQVWSYAEPKGMATLASTERELWTALLRVGRAVLALWLARRAAESRPAIYVHDSAQFKLDPATRRRAQVGTRFGKVDFVRPIGRAMEGRRRADLPLDREVGLCSSFSLGTVSAVVQLCALMAFGNARRLFATFHEWAPSPRATLRMVDAVGAEARGFLDASGVPDDDGEVLVIQVDGRGAPMISPTEYARRRKPKRRTSGNRRHARRLRRWQHPQPRRKKGDKSKNAKVAFVGVIYTLRSTPDGWEGPINKRLIATFESHEALFRWLAEHAQRRGYGRKRSLFLADGSQHIWRHYPKYFPKAIACVDWYHVVEKLWEAGESLFPEGSASLRQWVSVQKRRLRRGKIAEIIDTITAAHDATPKTGPGNKGRRKRLLSTLQYLLKHRHRMPYALLRRDDLDIGTGAVEGAVRNLVGLRLDGPGMRWGYDRAQMVLHLRCIALNDQWDDFRRYLETRPLKLAPQPRPARPHVTRSQQFRAAA